MTNMVSSACELAVIGTGMAGIAAAVFAQKNGISTAQAGVSGGILYASGYLDLMGVHPMTTKKTWDDPWQAMAALVKDMPDHPYARLVIDDIRTAFDQFLETLDAAGLPYRRDPDRNTRVITPVGTVKPTYAVPASMWAGAVGLAEKTPCLLIDFWGLKGFSAIQIAETLRPRWPNLTCARIPFPSVTLTVDLFTEQMARSLEVPANRKILADEIRPHLKGATLVGMPAILGMHRNAEIMADIENQLGCNVFEIPTMPPSMAGLRMKEKIEAYLTRRGVSLFSQKRVTRVQRETDGRFTLTISDPSAKDSGHTLTADGIILAAGRFLGMGLHADRKGIRETLFDLPVHQPRNRAHWHQEDFFDPAGHQINTTGLEIDDHFRPADRSGKPVYDNLFAAGSILAHQDWMRMKCGAGLAIATAWGAVRGFMKAMKKSELGERQL
jgi:glycerol-3-phosphate dehydrogenase subunit B